MSQATRAIAAWRRKYGQSESCLVEDAHDAIRVWIDEDAVTVDDSGTEPAWSRRDGNAVRHDLAGPDRAQVAGLRASLNGGPIRVPPSGSARRRRRLEIGAHFPANRPIILRIGDRWDRQQGPNDSEMQNAHWTTLVEMLG
jgi:hypothetical protein